MVANRLAVDGPSWASIAALYNSGTYACDLADIPEPFRLSLPELLQVQQPVHDSKLQPLQSGLLRASAARHRVDDGTAARTHEQVLSMEMSW
jgi:hypothetical protein